MVKKKVKKKLSFFLQIKGAAFDLESLCKKKFFKKGQKNLVFLAFFISFFLTFKKKVL
jgi:hypothetical protein